mmetsp:Transcript_19534/g.40444  ORF Transcript_19534/g.40444 Transcript_19534/m.40444 type:complete len:387 (+) Transcript_19534:81-1241(+)
MNSWADESEDHPDYTHGGSSGGVISNLGVPHTTPTGERPRLHLKPRSSTATATPASPSSTKPNPFGAAKPREEVLASKGIDPTLVDTRIEKKAHAPRLTAEQDRQVELLRKELTEIEAKMREANENELPEEEYRVAAEGKREELNELMRMFQEVNLEAGGGAAAATAAAARERRRGRLFGGFRGRGIRGRRRGSRGGGGARRRSSGRGGARRSRRGAARGGASRSSRRSGRHHRSRVHLDRLVRRRRRGLGRRRGRWIGRWLGRRRGSRRRRRGRAAAPPAEDAPPTAPAAETARKQGEPARPSFVPFSFFCSLPLPRLLRWLLSISCPHLSVGRLLLQLWRRMRRSPQTSRWLARGRDREGSVARRGGKDDEGHAGGGGPRDGTM